MDETSEQKIHQQQQNKKTAPKRKHVTLTISNKLKVIEKLERGVSGRLISEMFGISRQTVSDIKKHTEVIKAYAAQFDASSSTFSKRMTFKRTKDDRLESALLAWYMRQRRNDVSIKISDLKAAAEKLKLELRIPTVACNASWLARFRYRHNIKNSDVGITDEVEDPHQSESSYSMNENEESEERDDRGGGEVVDGDEASAVVPFDFIIKAEEEEEDATRETEWDYIPSEGNEQEESTTTTTMTSREKENLALKAAREGIDAVINYVGYSSNRGLWTQYEQLRIVRELIIEDQKKMHGNSLEDVEAKFNFPNT